MGTIVESAFAYDFLMNAENELYAEDEIKNEWQKNCMDNAKIYNLTDDFKALMNVESEENLEAIRSENAQELREEMTVKLNKVLSFASHPQGRSEVMISALDNCHNELKKLVRSVRDGYKGDSLQRRFDALEEVVNASNNQMRERYDFLGGVAENTRNGGRTHGHFAGEYKVY